MAIHHVFISPPELNFAGQHLNILLIMFAIIIIHIFQYILDPGQWAVSCLITVTDELEMIKKQIE